MVGLILDFLLGCSALVYLLAVLCWFGWIVGFSVSVVVYWLSPGWLILCHMDFFCLDVLSAYFADKRKSPCKGGVYYC